MAKRENLLKAKIAGFMASASYAHANAIYKEVNEKWSAAGKALNDFIDAQGPRGQMGLTPDSVKAMPQYIALRKACDEAAVMAREFNAVFTKRFAKEHKQSIMADREARWKAACGKE